MKQLLAKLPLTTSILACGNSAPLICGISFGTFATVGLVVAIGSPCALTICGSTGPVIG